MRLFENLYEQKKLIPNGNGKHDVRKRCAACQAIKGIPPISIEVSELHSIFDIAGSLLTDFFNDVFLTI